MKIQLNLTSSQDQFCEVNKVIITLYDRSVGRNIFVHSAKHSVEKARDSLRIALKAGCVLFCTVSEGRIQKDSFSKGKARASKEHLRQINMGEAADLMALQEQMLNMLPSTQVAYYPCEWPG